ncbi:unnamed protein product [Rotaria sp. Silwood2]|nr:unnamed protein product [Rotaria sp. Silwood2]CAF4013377.1 unnamed protein product [Rotaria sp. Silwood2]
MDADHVFIDIHQCLSLCSSSISNETQYGCMTLRYLHIRVIYTCFLEHLIEFVPNLERLSVYMRSSWTRYKSYKLNCEKVFELNSSWCNKVEKLKYLIVKSVVHTDFQLYYLKWIFNNLNHVEKVKLRLKIAEYNGGNEVIDGSPVDASFVRRHLMGDITINLTYFDFYIISHCKFLSNNIEKIIDSFKFEPFFIEHQWPNVKCLFDPIMSYQHLSSFIFNKSQFFNNLISYPDIFLWPVMRSLRIDLFPNLVRFLEQLDRFLPNVSSIEFDLRRYEELTNQSKQRAIILAYLISMPVQLNYLRIEQFQWLLHIVECAFNNLRKNALSTVRYVEFCLPSCYIGSLESFHVGKSLVPFLSNYMPYLQTLCIWKPDDLSWTYTERVNVFKEDLCQLTEQLKQLVFLNIYGKIDREKLKPYRYMVKKHFPNSHIYLEILRFRLWM